MKENHHHHHHAIIMNYVGSSLITHYSYTLVFTDIGLLYYVLVVLGGLVVSVLSIRPKIREFK